MRDDPLGLYAENQEATERRRANEERLLIAYRNTFDVGDGRVVFEDLAKFCGFTQANHVPGDSHSTAFNEGMRNVFLRIFTLSNHTLEDVNVRRSNPADRE